MGGSAVRPSAGRFRRHRSTSSPSSSESLDDLPDDRRQLRPLRQRLRDRIDGMRRAVETIKRAAGNGLDPHHQPGGAGAARSASSPPPSTPRSSSAQQRSPRRLGGDAGSDLRGACRTTRTATTRRSRRCAPGWSTCASARRDSPSRWISPSCCGRSASCCRSATASRSTSSTRAATTCWPPKRG